VAVLLVLLMIPTIVLLLFIQAAAISAQLASAKDLCSAIPEKRLQALPDSFANGVASM
jgi:hypothetical protein